MYERLCPVFTWQRNRLCFILADPYLSTSGTGREPIFVTVAALESSGIRARGTRSPTPPRARH